ncbi:autotransporter outer membrane beta-barrel domain-containing protein [Phascolarctobacterium faecium]|uniref:autotransporter outer membrane beta-barrel domain-containing protein n=1 Tax=Phascolarctobacterium faecium TaxID=33025 RepID=UPI003AEF85D3
MFAHSGGDNAAWASDYTGTDTLSTGTWGATYDKITITMDDPGKNCAGIYTYGRNNTTTATERVTVTLSDAGDTYGYNGIFVDGVSKLDAKKGIELTINGLGTNNQSGEAQAWRHGLRVETQGKVDLGTDIGSVITINSNAAESYANGVFVDGSSAGNGSEASIKGGDLTVNINKDNVMQQMDYAAGVTLYNGSKMELAGDLDIHLEAAGVDGIRANNLNYSGDINTLQVKNLAIYGKAVNGSGSGIYLMGEHDSANVSDSTKIEILGEYNVYGINIDSTGVTGSFGDTELTLTSNTANNTDVRGVRQWESATEYGDLTITARSVGADIISIELNGHDDKGTINIQGDLKIDAQGNGRYVEGIEANSLGEVKVAGKADIAVGGENDGSVMYGVYAQEHSKVAFADDARITTTTHAGNSNTKMYGIYSRTDAEVAFAKGLTVKNGNLGAAMIAEGGKVEVNMAGGNDVKLEGTVGSSAMYNSAHELTYGTVKINFDTAQSYFSGRSYKTEGSINDLQFTNGSYWDMKGNSSLTDLTVGKGSVVNMTADSGRYCSLQVDNLTAADGTFVMNAGAVDGGGSYSDKLTIDKNSAAGTNAIKIVSTGGLEAAARNHAVLVKGVAADTKFAVSDSVYANGLYEFDITLADKENDGKYDWVIGSLGKTTVNSVDVMSGSHRVAYGAWVEGNGTLRQRLGELQSGADNGVWARMFGGKLGGDEFTNKYKTYQFGYDAQAGDWLVGAAYEYSDGSLNYTSGSGKNKIGAVSLYGTLQGKDNSALDIVVKRGRIYGDMDIYGKYSDQGDYSTDATSIGVEYSKRFDGGNNVYFEPQAQLTFGRIDGYDYISNKGVKVAYDDLNSFIGRLGIVAGKAFSRGDVYVKASVLHEFSGNSSVTMLAANGESYSAEKDYGDTWLEVGIGGNITLGKNFELYGDVERSFGGDVTKNWGANVGFRYSF